jgi:hypothetical protein
MQTSRSLGRMIKKELKTAKQGAADCREQQRKAQFL